MSATAAAVARQRDPGTEPSAGVPAVICPPALSAKIWRLRFVSICAVVVVHSHVGRPPANGTGLGWSILRFLDLAGSDGFARIGLPFFFCASGYFFFNRARGPVSAWYWPQLRKRLKSLAVPYLLWTFAFTLLSEGVRLTPFAPQLVVSSSAHFSAGVWLDRILLRPIPAPLWSIRELLLYAAAAPLIWAALRFAGKTSLLVLTLWWCFEPNPERMFLCSRSLLFFFLGAYLALNAFPLSRFSLRKYRWWLAGTWVALVFGKSVLILNFGGSWRPLHVASVAIGILTLWTLHDSFPPGLRATLQRLSAHTFFVFVIHLNVADRVGRLWGSAWGPSNLGAHLTFDILGPPVMVLTAILVAFLIKRLWPAGYKVALGWRPAPPAPERSMNPA